MLLMPEDWGALRMRFFKVRLPIRPGVKRWGNILDIG
jgi:hypothetical protein